MLSGARPVGQDFRPLEGNRYTRHRQTGGTAVLWLCIPMKKIEKRHSHMRLRRQGVMRGRQAQTQADMSTGSRSGNGMRKSIGRLWLFLPVRTVVRGCGWKRRFPRRRRQPAAKKGERYIRPASKGMIKHIRIPGRMRQRKRLTRRLCG